MKKNKSNKGIFDKSRFEWIEKEKKEWLQNLSLKKSIKITEQFLSSNMFKQFIGNFVHNEPVCFKLGLITRKNVRTRI